MLSIYNTNSIFGDMFPSFDRFERHLEDQFQEAFESIASIDDLSLPFDLESLDDLEDLAPPAIEDDEHTYCKMKILRDDNGHVKVKTFEKKPGSDWKVKTKKFERPTGRKALGNGKKGKKDKTKTIKP